MTELAVFCDHSRVGELRAGPDRITSWSFRYDSTWVASPQGFAISASLPLQEDAHQPTAVRAFFAGLLPEGTVRQAVAQRLGLSPDNDAGLLTALGAECAGALSILPLGETPPKTVGHYEPLEPAQIAAMTKGHAVFAHAVGEHHLRLSLAGAQDKLPVFVGDDGSFALPVAGAPSTHILKVPSRDFKHLPANEVLMLALAREVGLPVVDAELEEVEGVVIAVVERYDRIREGNTIRRIHQEDLCQALAITSSNKYEQEGGPSLADAMNLTRRLSTDPLLDAQTLIDWQIFNVLAGNSDGHGKNLSLLYHRDGTRLAPLYDLVCTRAYDRLDRKLAMAVGIERDPGQIAAVHWDAMAKQLGVGRRFVANRVKRLCQLLDDRFDAAVHTLGEQSDSPAVERVRHVVTRQVRRTRHLLR